jgi:hypothetical protein
MGISYHQHDTPDKLLCRELDRQARLVDAGRASRQNHFVPPLPLRILERVEQSGAMAAMGLILAIHRQLIMRKRDSTPLNAAIWRAAGSPSKKRKEVILRNLARVPEVFVLEKAPSRQGYYRVARGALWKPEPGALHDVEGSTTALSRGK